MKLKPEEIDRIVTLVLDNLNNKKLVNFKADRDTVHSRMVDIFTHNLEEEEKLNEDVEEILQKFEKEIDSGQIDPRKMFNKIKTQLAKERNFIL